MPAESRPEPLALRTAIRELVALSTIPAAWIGREPATIATGVADVLIESLDLDFVFLRLRDPKGGAAVEVARGYASNTFPEWLRARFDGVDRLADRQIMSGPEGADGGRGVAVPIGISGDGGLVAVVSGRPGFPSEIDQLLLSVAANHAATAFQHARLRHELDTKIAELRHARSELEIKVRERTTALRQSEAYLADAQRLTHTGSWACNIITGQILHSSEEHMRLHGFDPHDGVPPLEAFNQRIHPEDRRAVFEAMHAASGSGQDVDIEFRLVLPDGTIRYLHSLGHPVIKQSGERGEFVGILTDVTQRRRADEERERLRQAQADLAYLSRVTTMGELTGSLAHEIRQPIAAAVTDAKTCLRWLARDKPAIDDARESAARVVTDVTRAADIITSISMLFQKGSLQREPVDVNALIHEMIVLLRSQANPHSISIRTELDPALPHVMVDRVQLQQVFMNLMLNGIDAMQETSGGKQLTIRSEADHDRLLLSVSDTGVGLPDGHSDQIFRAFFTTKAHGTGMGLPISRSIVESHGGRLWAIANERGATFQFSLPTALASRA